jgi:hypothetical protein
VEVNPVTELEIAEQAARNANLAEPRGDADEITGVNLEPPILIEDDNDDEDDENASQESEDSDGDVIFIGDNATNEAPEPEQIHEVHDEELETFNDEDTEELNMAGEEQLGRGRRKKKKTERLVEDATWGQNHAGLHEEVKLNVPMPKCTKSEWNDDETWKIRDGVLHINPSYMDFAKETLKVTNELSEADMDGINHTNIGEVQECANEKVLIEDHVVMHMLGVIFAHQYSVKEGIKLFGDRGRESVTKELQQLHDMVTYSPVHAHELTREQRKEALSSLMFLTEKRCGRVKTRDNGLEKRTLRPQL